MAGLRLNSLTALALASTALSFACQPPRTNSDSRGVGTSTSTATTAKTANGTSTANEAVSSVYQPAEFCKRDIQALLNNRTQIDPELAVFCLDKKPTSTFKSLYDEALASREKTIFKADTPREDDEGYSTIKLVWAFYSSKKVADFRNAPIAEQLAERYTSPTIDQVSSLEVNGELDKGGLHLSSKILTYDLTLKDPQRPDWTLNNLRKLQFNLYQVEAGNENLGLSIEHLLESSDKDYTRATMLNAAMSAPKDEGTVIVSILNYRILNRNWHSIAVNTVNEIAKHAGEAMRKAMSN